MAAAWEAWSAVGIIPTTGGGAWVDSNMLTAPKVERWAETAQTQGIRKEATQCASTRTHIHSAHASKLKMLMQCIQDIVGKKNNCGRRKIIEWERGKATHKQNKWNDKERKKEERKKEKEKKWNTWAKRKQKTKNKPSGKKENQRILTKNKKLYSIKRFLLFFFFFVFTGRNYLNTKYSFLKENTHRILNAHVIMQHRKEKKMQDQKEKEKKKKMERGKISSKKHTQRNKCTLFNPQKHNIHILKAVAFLHQLKPHTEGQHNACQLGHPFKSILIS